MHLSSVPNRCCLCIHMTAVLCFVQQRRGHKRVLNTVTIFKSKLFILNAMYKCEKVGGIFMLLSKGDGSCLATFSFGYDHKRPTSQPVGNWQHDGAYSKQQARSNTTLKPHAPIQ